MRHRTEDQIELTFIRHGATQANEEHRYIGRTDEPLSQAGIRSLLEYQKKGVYPDAGLVFSSPMKRCRETAGILYPQKTPVIIPEWEEMDFGAFEGKNPEELKEDRRYQEWIDSYGTLPFPGGESREAFCRRCERGFHRMIKKLSQPAENDPVTTVCAIVHGGTIMALLSRYGGGDYFDYQVPAGAGYRCLLKWNGHDTRLFVTPRNGD